MSYPIMLQIEARKAVVVGGGFIATRKVKSLLKAKANVTVVAPSIHENLVQLLEEGKINWLNKKFEQNDVDGAFIIIAATNVTAVNLEVYEASKDKLLNIVDRPDLCTFHVPAVFECGSLTLAISTGGVSPALAKELKRKFGEVFDDRFEKYLLFLQQSREIVFKEIENKDLRKEVFQQLVSELFYREGNWHENFKTIILTIKKDAEMR